MLHKIAKEIIFHGTDQKTIKRVILKYNNFQNNEIPKEYVIEVKKKILSLGIEEGWLLDEYFVE